MNPLNSFPADSPWHRTLMEHKHPLTDEMYNKLSTYPLEEIADEYANGTMADMRAAADWQLEKCDDELGNILHCLALAGKITEEERIQIYVLFKEAMRP